MNSIIYDIITQYVDIEYDLQYVNQYRDDRLIVNYTIELHKKVKKQFKYAIKYPDKIQEKYVDYREQINDLEDTLYFNNDEGKNYCNNVFYDVFLKK